jgi:hypothetical protein
MAICGIEYQQRGSAHAHVIIDQNFEFQRARALWVNGAGYCWLQAIRNSSRAIGYAIKDAVKRGEVNIYGRYTSSQFSTLQPSKKNPSTRINLRDQLTFINQSNKNPNEYESEAYKELSGKHPGKLA